MKSERCSECHIMTPHEVEALRGMLQSRSRFDWLWANVGRWLRWGMVAGGSAVVLWEHIRHFFQWLERISK